MSHVSTWMGDRLGIHGAVDTFTSLGSDQYLAEETNKKKKHQQLKLIVEYLFLFNFQSLFVNI